MRDATSGLGVLRLKSMERPQNRSLSAAFWLGVIY